LWPASGPSVGKRMGWKNLGEKVPGLIAGGQIRSAVTVAALMLLRDRRTGEG
jgi:hypothetical protein